MIDPTIKICDSSVYFPSDDSYLILDYFQSKITPDYFDGIQFNSINNVLDMGTGSGIIAITLLLLKSNYDKFNPKIYASDILEQAIKCAKINEKANGFKGEIEYFLSNLFKSFPEHLNNLFNIIIFNPPYLPSSELIEKQERSSSDYCWNGGINGNEIICEFINKLKDFLNVSSNYEASAYFISSSRADNEKDNEKLERIIIAQGFKHDILAKKHVFFEDIILNRLKLKDP
ncbi:MAG: HemK2/MTQ2 family protein methyltransferase [Promethearchaeota archaeon]